MHNYRRERLDIVWQLYVDCLEQVGSTHFSSPEVLLSLSYSRAADMWSAGVLMYLLLCGHLPFDGVQLSDSICHGAFDVCIDTNTTAILILVLILLTLLLSYHFLSSVQFLCDFSYWLFKNKAKLLENVTVTVTVNSICKWQLIFRAHAYKFWQFCSLFICCFEHARRYHQISSAVSIIQFSLRATSVT